MLPETLNFLRRKEILLQQFSEKSEENKRMANYELAMVGNSRKFFAGQLAALQMPRLIEAKRSKENDLRKRVSAHKNMEKSCGDAWEIVEHAEKHASKIRDILNLFEGGRAFDTNLFEIARHLVRLEAEEKKKNNKRLPEYSEAQRKSLLEKIFSKDPLYKHFEEYNLADSLALLAETLGFDNKHVRKVLRGKSPRERARELIAGTELFSVKARKELAPGGGKKPSQAKDELILLVRAVDGVARKVRKDFEENIKEPKQQAYAKIARAQFEMYGKELYPDATGTLRVAYGRALGYKENGQSVPLYTEVREIFKHAQNHNNEAPWKLPESWQKKRAILSKSKNALNFITTHDTHGGNSGSPVIDKDLYIHGILFDGNAAKLANSFRYTDEMSRAISVHSSGILEILEKVYNAKELVDELTEKN